MMVSAAEAVTAAKRAVPTWSRLNGFGQSRVLRSSYVWFFAVPVVAKAAQWLSVRAAEEGVILDWDLPFSWRVFYFSAVAFAGASVLYGLRCPDIIRDHVSFSSFAQTGRGDRQLAEYMLRAIPAALPGSERARDPAAFREFLAYGQNPRDVWEVITHDARYSDLRRAGYRVQIEQEDLGDAFWFVRDYADRTYLGARLVCGVLYLIGFILVTWVMFENFMFVVAVLPLS